MTAPILIKVTSATFKGKAIVGAESAEIAIVGSTQMARGDGAQAMQIAYVEGIHAKVSIRALQGHITDKDLMMPGSGALVVTGFVQDQGVTIGAAHVWTFPNATHEGGSRSAPLDGNPAVNLPFTIVAPTGDPLDLYSVT